MTGLFVLTALAGGATLVATQLIPDWMHAWTIDIFLGLGGAVLLGTIGFILSARRLYAYAFLTVIILSIGYLFNGPLWLSLMILSGVMILTGLAVLVRFLSEHPRIN